MIYNKSRGLLSQTCQSSLLHGNREQLLACRYVMPRPEGRRCLVISSQHMTISRHRNGSILHKFPSILPNGSRASRAGSGDDFCILDCIFHEPDSTYYIVDMMCWKGYNLYDCSAEFRLFWVQSKLAECTPGQGQEQHRYPFVPVPAFTCTQGDRPANIPDSETCQQSCFGPAFFDLLDVTNVLGLENLLFCVPLVHTDGDSCVCRRTATRLFSSSAIPT